MGKTKLAIVGSGATAIYILKHLVDEIPTFREDLESITIFEKSGTLGMGMPYSPETTDIYNLANISSEEIPELPETFGDWLRTQKAETLDELNIKERPITDSEVYSRLALGRYFQNQYIQLTETLRQAGIEIIEKPNVQVKDIKEIVENGKFQIETSKGKSYEAAKIIIATGHSWSDDDKPDEGYFASPWPISKLLSYEKATYNFTIGTLGASLSAFDVVTSLAHRNGKFTKTEEGLKFERNKNVPDFKIIMHSAEGWLPHLQYEQRHAMREIYRHTTREEMLSLINPNGFLTLAIFYDKVCRPALIKALERDKLFEIAEKIKGPRSDFQDFVALMSERHEYSNSFEGMRREMVDARKSVDFDRPIHWKETLDDLMYCLNFHAELLPAEDHIVFQNEIMSFLMNVIAALPLSSANILLALEEAGCIEVVAGRVKVIESNEKKNYTVIQVEDENGETRELEYRMFVNCSGQKSVGLEDYPFPSLVADGIVCNASAQFNSVVSLAALKKGVEEGNIYSDENEVYLYTGGIDVDAAYRTIRDDGQSNENLFDITFTHTSGCRPYSYGLQACSATSKILVESWKLALISRKDIESDVETMTKIYTDDNTL